MIRQEQCNKVCRILDDVLANRPTERDSLIVAVQKAFNALEQAETNCSEIPNNSDTISRQQAIDALKTDMASLDHIIKGMSAYDVRLDAYVSQRNQVNCDIDTISNLPTAQPERKTGHWIAITSWNNTYKCSVCGRLLVNITDGKNKVAKNYPYCHCGAKMEGGEADE